MYRAFSKEAIDRFFGEQFKKSHVNLKKIIFLSYVSDRHQKKYSKFSYYYAELGAVQGALQKKQLQLLS